MTLDPALVPLVDRVRAASAAGAQLAIRGGGTKNFYGEPPTGEPFDVRGFSGISSHEPSELVVTARCGTPLAELEAALAEHGQCLPFEPPHFGDLGTETSARGATVGGMVAAGLAGPARAAVGSVRDYVLGATLLNGRGEVLSFGGQVMKNVAGYDVSRLLAGSMGILGVIVEVSLKVLPLAPASATLRFAPVEQQDAIDRLNEWGREPLPINASAWWDGPLVLRLRGAAAAVAAAVSRFTNSGAELIEPALAASFWAGMRDHHDQFFVGAERATRNAGDGIARTDGSAPCALWRLSLPSTTSALPLSGQQLVEWGGAQRWLCTTTPAAQIREAAARAGGHATLFSSHPRSTGVFAPLQSPLDRIHRELKKAFDPAGVFNPGRLYPGL